MCECFRDGDGVYSGLRPLFFKIFQLRNSPPALIKTIPTVPLIALCVPLSVLSIPLSALYVPLNMLLIPPRTLCVPVKMLSIPPMMLCVPLMTLYGVYMLTTYRHTFTVKLVNENYLFF